MKGNNILRSFKNNKIIRFIYYNLNVTYGKTSILPDRIYLKICYKKKFGEKLNLYNPNKFNEKIQWLKLYDHRAEYTQMVDKYEVNSYVAEKIGEEYILPIINVYNNADEIDFDSLPDQFVLKCTHDSGSIIICKDKSKLDESKVIFKLDSALRFNYYRQGREWPYKNVKPRIICQDYLGDNVQDIKTYCFNGQPKFSYVQYNIYEPNGTIEPHFIDYYDIGWNLMPFERGEYKNSGKLIPQPENYDEIIRISKILSKDIPFVRVDFFNVNGRLYFGELTLSPGGGMDKFYPESYNDLFGSWITLPQTKTNS
ncbi:MAG TPA: glycosyl transferase [Clostridiales bacterium]|jgi:hypothetical protein|nr:glycosyl transferase [Clostridiales bacterium]